LKLRWSAPARSRATWSTPIFGRRNGEEKIDLPSPGPPHPPNELQEVLGRTFGVPLFQEQAMKIAIVAAGFHPGRGQWAAPGHGDLP
jgi:DNA polymerase III alpha subunit